MTRLAYVIINRDSGEYLTGRSWYRIKWTLEFAKARLYERMSDAKLSLNQSVMRRYHKDKAPNVEVMPVEVRIPCA